MNGKWTHVAGQCFVLIAGATLGTGCAPKESGSRAEPDVAVTKTMLTPAPDVTPASNQARGAAHDAKAESSPDSSLQLTKPELEVTNFKATPASDGLASEITGTIRNNSDRAYTDAQIEIVLYDIYGSQTGSVMVNCNRLEPHGTCNFKLSTLAPGTTRGEVKGVTGF